MTPKEVILNSAIETLEKRGLAHFTVRNIAKDAQVNVAAISYHFGSKDSLLKEIQRLTLHHAFGDFKEQIYNKDGKSSFELLGNFLDHVLQGALTYPNISKMHFSKAFNENDYKDILSRKMREFFEDLLIVSKTLVKRPENDLKASLLQILSAIYFAGLFQGVYGNFLDLTDEKTRHLYVKKVVDVHFRR